MGIGLQVYTDSGVVSIGESPSLVISRKLSFAPSDWHQGRLTLNIDTYGLNDGIIAVRSPWYHVGWYRFSSVAEPNTLRLYCPEHANPSDVEIFILSAIDIQNPLSPNRHGAGFETFTGDSNQKIIFSTEYIHPSVNGLIGIDEGLGMKTFPGANKTAVVGSSTVASSWMVGQGAGGVVVTLVLRTFKMYDNRVNVDQTSVQVMYYGNYFPAQLFSASGYKLPVVSVIGA